MHYHAFSGDDPTHSQNESQHERINETWTVHRHEYIQMVPEKLDTIIGGWRLCDFTWFPLCSSNRFFSYSVSPPFEFLVNQVSISIWSHCDVISVSRWSPSDVALTRSGIHSMLREPQRRVLIQQNKNAARRHINNGIVLQFVRHLHNQLKDTPQENMFKHTCASWFSIVLSSQCFLQTVRRDKWETEQWQKTTKLTPSLPNLSTAHQQSTNESFLWVRIDVTVF